MKRTLLLIAIISGLFTMGMVAQTHQRQVQNRIDRNIHKRQNIKPTDHRNLREMPKMDQNVLRKKAILKRKGKSHQLHTRRLSHKENENIKYRRMRKETGLKR